MKTVKIAAAVCAALLMCSCGGKEPNDMAFVVALGFDRGAQSRYEITIQFARVNQISGGASEEGGKAGSGIIQNVTVQAPDIYSAINTANHIVSKKFSLSHAKLIVFSRELAEEGIGPVVDTVIRSSEIKPDVYMAVAKDTAKGYLDEVKPVVEVNPAKYYQLVYGENESGGTPKTNLLNFYFNKETGTRGSVVPLAGTAETAGEDDTENPANKNAPVNEGGFEYKVKNYTAGEAAVDGENKSEAMGMAVFSGDKMTGTLGSIEGELYNLLSGTLRRSYISFKSSMGDTPVVAKIFQYKKPRYGVDVKNRRVEIKLYIESDLYSSPRENYDEDKLEEELAADINGAAEDFVRRARDELGCDILGIEKKAAASFLTEAALAEYDFKADFKNYEIHVDTELEIRRVGMNT